MLNETFLFKGKRANSMGIELQESIIISNPYPKFTQHVIPGRNGSVYEYDGTYEDRPIYASCYLLSHLLERDIDAINSWLISDPGYYRFEDTKDPTHFMMAVAKNGIERHARNEILNTFSLEFSAKPQRFLKIGEKQISIPESGATIKNPTKYTSFPLIEFSGVGNFEISIAGKKLTIKEITSPIFYDAEADSAYRGNMSLDSKVGSSDRIALPPGEIPISISTPDKSTFLYMKITPRWWEL